MNLKGIKHSLNAVALASCLALSLPLTGAWDGNAGERESDTPKIGPALIEFEDVVAPEPTQDVRGNVASPASRTHDQKVQHRIEQKLEMARRAVAAAEAAGTRELDPNDLRRTGGDASADEKMRRLAELAPSALETAPGSPEAARAESGEVTDPTSMDRSARRETDTRVLEQAPTPEQVAHALAATDATPADASPERSESRAGMPGEDLPTNCTMDSGPIPFAGSAYCDQLGFLDDDTCHYARGTTLILHVFVNHGDLTWSAEERGQSIAKANQAKDWYRAQAPANAYMRFDHEDTGQGYYVICDLEDELPDPGSHGWVDDACAALGFTDDDGDGFISDELTVWYQDQFGGWDNVIAVFQPADVFFQATASMERGACKIPPSASWQTWSHEWGHCYGAADEYGNCNGWGCGDIAGSCYLTDDVPNGNCETDPCGVPVSCMMRANSSGVPPCSFTQRHWGWIDANDDGLLDTTLWNDAGDAQNLYELFHNGYFIHTNTDWGMVAKQVWPSWSVIGLRARNTAAYDLRLYGDNNFRYYQAGSTGHAANYVNYVVGDFNRNQLGQDFIDISKFSGSGQYVLSYESGTGMLFPDGVERSQTWQDYHVVRAFDVPLFGGETITFDLDITTPGLDLGMALYKSNPGGGTNPYYAGRTSGLEQWEANSWPAGVSESHTFTVPQDDVYGLIVWSNNEVDGDWDIKIGPTPSTLVEETPHTSFLDLRLYNYVPTANAWAVTAVRPEAATNVSLSLFAESTYQTELASSTHYPNVEFIAADYNDGASTDYLRVHRTSGVNSFTTEWEQGPEIFNGFEPGSWGSSHLCRVWDTYLVAGTTYFFRLYETAPPYLDGSIFLMSSAGGDNYLQRNLRSAQSAGQPASEGEWFTFTPAATDWYGFVMVAEDNPAGNSPFTIGVGPRVTLAPNAPIARNDEVVWADVSASDNAWNVVGVRADAGVVAQIGLWACESFATDCFVTTDLNGGGVTFVAMDGYALGDVSFYPRLDRKLGSGEMTGSFDVAETTISWDAGEPVESTVGTWVEDEVAQATNLNVRASSERLYIEVTPLVPGMDLGVAVLRNSGGDPVQASFEAVVDANEEEAGGSEIVELSMPETGRYGIVVTNNNGVAGDYRIRVMEDAPTSDVPEISERLEFRMTSANPSSDEAAFALSIPNRNRVELSIYDVRGRLVRSVTDRTLEAGVHGLVWDGRDDQGRGVAAGLYLARLTTENEKQIVKVIRAE